MAAPATATLTEQAIVEIAYTEGAAGAQLAALGRFLTQTESVSSSKIERVEAGSEDFARALVGIKANPSAVSMVAATEALNSMVDRAGETGRIELDDLEKSYVSAAGGEIGQSASESQKVTVFPHWSRPYDATPPLAAGEHGGGDALLLEDIFGAAPPADPLGRRADHLAGARSILTGIAANQAFATGLPVRVDDLVRLA